jgi:hypothetical protein
MAEKTTVTVPLTAKQKEQIKRATGKTISALKVGASGGFAAARKPRMIVGRRVQLARKVALTKKFYSAKRTIS